MIPEWMIYFMIASLLASVVVVATCMAAGLADELQQPKKRQPKSATLQRRPLSFRQKLVT